MPIKFEFIRQATTMEKDFKKLFSTVVIVMLVLILQSLVYEKSGQTQFGKPFRLPPPLQSDEKIRRLPQALIIGVKKCGTGTLGRFLEINSKITFTSEPHFFDLHYEKGYSWYLSKMKRSSANQITMEGSPRYFVYPNAAGRIYAMNASLRLIMIVRDPITRLLSDYVHYKDGAGRSKLEYPTFTNAVFDKMGKVNITYEPVYTGMYSNHLKRWYSLFSKSQILILDGENLQHNPWEELNRVEKFLNLKSVITKEHFMFSGKKGFFCLNKSGVPACMGASKGRKHPDVPPSQLNMIRKYYEPYNEEFFRMTGLYFNWNEAH